MKFKLILFLLLLIYPLGEFILNKKRKKLNSLNQKREDLKFNLITDSAQDSKFAVMQGFNLTSSKNRKEIEKIKRIILLSQINMLSYNKYPKEKTTEKSVNELQKVIRELKEKAKIKFNEQNEGIKELSDRISFWEKTNLFIYLVIVSLNFYFNFLLN